MVERLRVFLTLPKQSEISRFLRFLVSRTCDSRRGLLPSENVRRSFKSASFERNALNVKTCSHLQIYPRFGQFMRIQMPRSIGKSETERLCSRTRATRVVAFVNAPRAGIRYRERFRYRFPVTRSWHRSFRNFRRSKVNFPRNDRSPVHRPRINSLRERERARGTRPRAIGRFEILFPHLYNEISSE